MLKFDRNELSGAFGDIGTDLPLIVGMILVCGLDSASVLIIFGALQIFTGFFYRLPMPVQPLKAMATIMLSQRLSSDLLYGAGISIGIFMFILSITGLLEWIGKIIPKTVVRGIQFGLGLMLALLALKNYVPSLGVGGYILAFIGFVLTVFLLGNRKYPPAIFVVLFGIVYALIFKTEYLNMNNVFGFTLPKIHTPKIENMISGFLLLSLPQIPLSLGNSVIATKQTIVDLFPERKIGLKKIGLTYSFMNIVSPFFSGIPVCHGAGGLGGHYAFGARTGGSVVIYGSIYIILGLFFSRGFESVIKIFPMPILGVILLFEGLTMMRLIKDISDSKGDLFISLLVGVMVVALPYGYVAGMVIGTLIIYLMKKRVETW